MGKRLLIPAIVAATLAAMLLAAYFVMGMGKKHTARSAPKITLLTPPAPPPPPPPPPKFEKKPDPPKEQIKVEQPVPKQDSPPPSPELKMDGPAGNGPSAFAAGKITSEDLSHVGAGKPGGEGGKRDNWQETNYENLAKGEISRYLRNATRNRRQGNLRYTADFLIWASPSGAIQRFKLLKSTRDSDTDALISEVMAGLASLSAGPPPSMEQPIKLRVRIGT
jgi:protein TonB